MCTAKNRGGQRCHSSAKKSLAKAHATKVATEVAYTQAVAADAPTPVREKLLRKGLAAEYAYEDALAQYASTVKGRADLHQRLAEAPNGYHQADTTDPNRADDDITIKTALQEGHRLMTRAAETKRAVKAGEMSAETAIERSTYPTSFALEHRATQIDATVARIAAREEADARASATTVVSEEVMQRALEADTDEEAEAILLAAGASEADWDDDYDEWVDHNDPSVAAAATLSQNALVAAAHEATALNSNEPSPTEPVFAPGERVRVEFDDGPGVATVTGSYVDPHDGTRRVSIKYGPRGRHSTTLAASSVQTMSRDA